MKYRKVHSVLEVEQLATGEQVRLAGWSITKMHGNKLWVGDGAALLEIQGLPDSISSCVNYPGDIAYGLEVHVQIYREELDAAAVMHFWYPSTPKTILMYFEPPKPTCDCGAVHTFLPSYHSTWCTIVRHAEENI